MANKPEKYNKLLKLIVLIKINQKVCDSQQISIHVTQIKLKKSRRLISNEANKSKTKTQQIMNISYHHLNNMSFPEYNL